MTESGKMNPAKRKRPQRLPDAARPRTLPPQVQAPANVFPGSDVIVVSASSSVADAAPAPVGLQQLADEILGDPSAWFSTPNPNLGGRKPADLVETDEERKVHDLLSAVDQGLF